MMMEYMIEFITLLVIIVELYEGSKTNSKYLNPKSLRYKKYPHSRYLRKKSITQNYLKNISTNLYSLSQ